MVDGSGHHRQLRAAGRALLRGDRRAAAARWAARRHPVPLRPGSGGTAHRKRRGHPQCAARPRRGILPPGRRRIAGSVVGVAASVGHPLGGRRAPPSTVLAAGEALRLPPRADRLGGAEHGVRRVPHPLHIVGRATRVGRGHRLRRCRPDLRFQRPAVGSSRRVGRRHSSAHGGGQRARRLCHRCRGPHLRLPAEADGGRGARRGRTPGGRQGCRR